MLSQKTLCIVWALNAFAFFFSGAAAPVIAGDSNKGVAAPNRATKTPLDDDALPDRRRPQAPHGLLMRINVGGQGARTNFPIGTGGAPFQTTVRAVRGDALIVQTPQGEETFMLRLGSPGANAIPVGTKLTVTRTLNGATLQFRLPNQPATPYAGIYVGAVEAAGPNFVKLRLLGGTVQTFSSDRNVAQIARTLSGKTIALQSNDGRSARSLLTAQQLNDLLKGTPPTAPVRAPIPSSQSHCQLPAKPSNAVTVRKTRYSTPCDVADVTRKPVERFPRSTPSRGLGLLTAATGCSNSNSAAIFIALRHWRSQTPVRGASVQLSGPASITLNSPPSGYIELLNVPSGTYHVSVQRSGLRDLQTGDFHIDCNEGVRVQANLQTVPRSVRFVKIPRREFAFRVVARQKAPLNCFYGSGARQEASRVLEKPFVLKTATGTYVCGLKKVPTWKKQRK